MTVAGIETFEFMKDLNSHIPEELLILYNQYEGINVAMPVNILKPERLYYE